MRQIQQNHSVATSCLIAALASGPLAACNHDGGEDDTTANPTTTGSGTATASDTGGDSTTGMVDPQVACNGVFSDGTIIQLANPTWLEDIPGTQTFCDFHTFAWNQFAWLIQNDPAKQTPRFLDLAPWQNLFTETGAPTPYPGGSTALNPYDLDKAQAGDDYDLIDIANKTVLYDMRFNETMYNSIRSRNFYMQAAYDAACAPDPTTKKCTHNLWLPPNAQSPNASLELKSSWRQFDPGLCPATMYCSGDLGLVGVHLVQKTVTHGEWIWASFEHIDNSPDCNPGGAHPIAATAPTGQPWSFYSPNPAEIASQSCDIVSTPPSCNADPRVDPSCSPSGTTVCEFKFTNICRADQLPAGGASAANCMIGGGEQATANNRGNVACLNSTLAPQLTGPWANYELIGTLWTKGTLAPTQDFRIQTFQTQVAGLPYVEPVGFPNLANTTMETWLQTGSTGFSPFGSGYTAGCFSCHNPPSASFGLDLSHSIDKIRQ